MPGILTVSLKRWRACAPTLWVLCTIQCGYRLQFLLRLFRRGNYDISIARCFLSFKRRNLFFYPKGAGGYTREDGGRVLQPLLPTPKEAGACARFWIYGSLTSNSDVRSSKCLLYVIWFRDRFGTKHSYAVTSQGPFSYSVETAGVYGLNNSSRLAGSSLYACVPEMGTEHWSECHTAFIQTSDDNASVCSSSGSLGISGLLSII